MKKAIKTILLMGGTAFVGYVGFKMYGKVKQVIQLDKDLPDFIEKEFGEVPKVGISFTWNMKWVLAIKLKVSSTLMEKKEEIETSVKEYINDFYPTFTKHTIKVEVVELTPIPEETSEEVEEPES